MDATSRTVEGIIMIPEEVREQHWKVCKECGIRKDYARMDFHFDWLDCPYECEIDYEHWKGEQDES